MPFAIAAKRAGTFKAVPMTLDFDSDELNEPTYFRTNGPISETEPARARPRPSRMDFRPSSKTSGGISSYFVLTMKSATYFVSPGAVENSPEFWASAGILGAANRPNVAQKCRRFIEFPFPCRIRRGDSYQLSQALPSHILSSS